MTTPPHGPDRVRPEPRDAAAPHGGPTPLLRAQELAWTPPGRSDPLFERLDVVLADGDRLGVIGPNGCGKTTLLRLLAGRLVPDTGRVQAAARGWLVPQAPPRGPVGATLRDVLLGLDPELGPVRSRLRAAERAGVPDADGYAADLARYDEARGWDAELRAEVEAERLGLGAAALDRPADGASGGERRMLALAAVLAREPRLLLLDEPSDALDARSRTALAERLRVFDGALVVASHDRALLDAVTTRTLAFEHDGVRSARGGYGRYAAVRAEERADRERRAGRARREIAHLEQVVRGYRTWSGRKEKEKSGALDKGFVGARAARLMKRATVAAARREAEIEELRRAKPWVEPDYALPMPLPTPRSGTVFACHGANAVPPGAPRDAPAFAPLDLRIEAGERVAIAGPNGAGKSTLLALLVGRLPARNGRVTRMRRATLGYLPQAGSALDGEEDRGSAQAGAHRGGNAVPDEAAEGLFGASEAAEARRRLGALGFGADAWSTPRSRLSGGQRQKLRIVRRLADAPDVLVLDEPTLHLDLPAIERLQDALVAWPGTIVLVSHDAAFVGAVAERVVRLGDEAG